MNTPKIAGLGQSVAIRLLAGAILALSTPIFADLALSSEPVRITTSFDVKYAPAVLRQVAKVFGNAGFGRAEADRVSQDIDALKADQAKAWEYTVQYQGHGETLQIRALLDDLGMIDLDFSTSPEAAPAVRAAVDSYLNGRSR